MVKQSFRRFSEYDDYDNESGSTIWVVLYLNQSNDSVGSSGLDLK